jgi:hypothetical protein
MLAKKIMLAALGIPSVGVITTSAGFVGQVPAPRTAKFQPQVRQARKPEPSEVAAKANDAIARPASGRMLVVGRVLDPEGKPVAHAKVAVQARTPKPRPFSFFETDADCRFRANPPSGDRYHIAAWPPPGSEDFVLQALGKPMFD